MGDKIIKKRSFSEIHRCFFVEYIDGSLSVRFIDAFRAGWMACKSDDPFYLSYCDKDESRVDLSEEEFDSLINYVTEENFSPEEYYEAYRFKEDISDIVSNIHSIEHLHCRVDTSKEQKLFYLKHFIITALKDEVLYYNIQPSEETLKIYDVSDPWLERRTSNLEKPEEYTLIDSKTYQELLMQNYKRIVVYFNEGYRDYDQPGDIEWILTSRKQEYAEIDLNPVCFQRIFIWLTENKTDN